MVEPMYGNNTGSNNNNNINGNNNNINGNNNNNSGNNSNTLIIKYNSNPQKANNTKPTTTAITIH